MSMMGRLIVISGCSAAGKTTLVERLLAERSAAARPVTHTTRQPRAGEVSGVHYHFVSREDFLALVDGGGMVEFAEVHGNLYGTSKKAIQDVPPGMVAVAILDVEGARSMRKAFPGCLTVFIDVPVGDLRRRITERGDSPEEIRRRMNAALWERSCICEFDRIIENLDIERATRMLFDIFDKAHAGIDRSVVESRPSAAA